MPPALPQSARAVGGLQISQHQGQGVWPAATASRGRAIPCDFALSFGLGRQPLGVRLRRGRPPGRPRPAAHAAAPDAEPADLDQARQGRGRTHQQPSVRGFDMGAVVGHQPRERQSALLAPRAAAPARAAICPSRRARGSARRARRPARRKRGSKAIDRRHHTAGRRTMKRAPSTLRLAAVAGRDGGAVLGPDAAADGPR